MKAHRWVAVLGLAVLLIETAYFGWNWTAQSRAEQVWDWFGAMLVLQWPFAACVRMYQRMDAFLSDAEAATKGKP